ncbi:DUF3352 domain-containing protein [Candidatus Peregrinibacteria bacterium]|nr:DUF3352 domain-containing protein [Candidatus Peregrinibacteria bacterium]
MSRLRFFLIFSLLTTFLFTGCQFRKTDFEKASLSLSGKMAEDYLPENTSILLSLNTFFDDQRDSLSFLRSYFPSFSDKTFEEQFGSTFLKEIAFTGITYDKDIRPILSDQNRVVVAFDSNIPQSIYLSFLVKDEEKYTALLDMFRNANGKTFGENKTFTFTEAVYKKNTIFTLNESISFTRFDDVALLSSSDKAIQASIDQFASKNTLRRSPTYVSVIKRMISPYIGYAYFDAELLLRQMDDRTQSSNQIYQNVLGKDSFARFMKAYAFTFQAEKDGIKMFGYLLGDKEIMKEQGVNLKDFRGDGQYFVKKMPASDLIFYNEGKNFKSELELILKSQNSTNATSLPQVSPLSLESIDKFFEAWMKMDFEKDILSFLNGPYLFGFSRNEKSVLPGISFLVDASSDVPKAQAFLSALKAQLVSGINVLTFQFSFLAPALTLGEMSVKDDTLQVLSLDLSKISSPEQFLPKSFPPILLNEKLTIIFGLLDNTFVFSTYSKFGEEYLKASLSDSPEFREVFSKIDGGKGEIAYAHISEAKLYIDQFVDLLSYFAPSQDIKSQYEKFRMYLLPLKSVVAQTESSEYDMTVQGFLGISEGKVSR